MLAPVPYARRQPHTDCSRMHAPTSAIGPARMRCAHVLVFGTDAIGNLWKRREQKQKFEINKENR